MLKLRPLLSLPRRFYHTNGTLVNSSDPFKTLGLEWGATTDEIKTAYRKLAMRHHPDVGSEKDPEKFQTVQKAYDALMAKSSDDGDEANDQFSWDLWRKGDIIAQERRDVAGEMKQRPVRPVGISTAKVIGFSGSVPVNKGAGGDLLGDGSIDEVRKTSSVGSGVSKWHSRERKEYKPWSPNA